MRALLNNDEEMFKSDFINAYNEACLWASPNVSKAIYNCLSLPENGVVNQAKLHDQYNDCIKAMRSDCGFNVDDFDYIILEYKGKPI